VAADAALRPARLRRLAPAGDPVALRALVAALRDPAPEATLARALEAVLGPGRLALHHSGREALRASLASLAQRTSRREVVVPGYTCFSVPAAAVAAGLRVRLVDVDERGRIDPGALAKLPLERAAAVVVCNLFGAAEPVTAVRRLAAAAGAALVDDAAQALGARCDDGPAGARGDVGILSFARGKPLAALGGGASFVPGATGGAGAGSAEHDRAPAASPAEAPSPAPAARTAALLRALAYAVARDPHVFGWLAALPFLGIGETPYEPAFVQGPIEGASLRLAAAEAPRLLERAAARRARALALAREIETTSAFRPLLADPPASGVYPRLALRAPDAAARDAALQALDALGAGASAFYPSALDAVPGLAPALAGDAHVPGARELAARILTLPTHDGLREPLRARVVAALARAGRGAR